MALVLQQAANLNYKFLLIIFLLISFGRGRSSAHQHPFSSCASHRGGFTYIPYLSYHVLFRYIYFISLSLPCCHICLISFFSCCTCHFFFYSILILCCIINVSNNLFSLSISSLSLSFLYFLFARHILLHEIDQD